MKEIDQKCTRTDSSGEVARSQGLIMNLYTYCYQPIKYENYFMHATIEEFKREILGLK